MDNCDKTPRQTASSHALGAQQQDANTPTRPEDARLDSLDVLPQLISELSGYPGAQGSIVHTLAN